MIDWEAVGNFVATVGVPAAVCFWMLAVSNKTNKEGFEKLADRMGEIVQVQTRLATLIEGLVRHDR